MELGTYSDLTSFIGEAFPYYRTWQSFTIIVLGGISFIFVRLIILFFSYD